MKTMRRILLSAVALLFATGALAQPAVGTFSILPHIGVSLANLPGDKVMVDAEVPFSAHFKAGFAGGIDLDYQFMRNLSVSLGAYYAQQGCRYENATVEYDASGNTVKSYGYSDMSTKLNYLNVPLMLNGYIGPGFAIKVGVQMEFATSGKLKYTTTPYERNDEGNFVVGSPENHEDNLNKMLRKTNVSIPVGVSYEFSNVIIDARYNIALGSAFDKKWDGDTKNRVLMFSAAYRFAL